MWADNETTEDFLNYEVHCDLIKEYVTNPNLLPLTIGVFGDWGSGKSSIMKILEQKLEDDEKVLTIYFNSWLFESYQDAKISLLENILLELSKNETLGETAKKKILSLISRVDYMKLAKDGIKKYGKNVVESDDKTSLISTKEGRLEYAGDKLQVNDVFSIKGNIDTSTGNIHFGGDIVVHGDIKTGFEVNCAGSLEVNGVIEAANIVVGRDLVVKGGIQGNAKSSIKVSGSTICRFIENACVFSEGDIITDFVVHSNISCGSNLVVKGKKGLIVGGEIRVKNEINAQVIGSYMGTKTVIEIGLDPSQKNKLDAYRDELHSYEKKLKELQPTIETGKQLLQRGLMDNIKKISFVKMLEDYNKTVQNISIVETEIQKIEKQLSEIRYGMMQVKDKIYPGVKITIGRYSRYIKDETGASKFYVQDGDIVIHKN